MIVSESYREVPGFSDVKASEVASHFVARAGQPIDKLKLIKLIYLADRLAMEELGRPLLNDEHFSLKNGPICSLALDGINGKRAESVWAARIRRSGHSVQPSDGTAQDYDETSPREARILDRIWERFGAMTTTQVWKWTHDHCPEYEEVGPGCRRPITYERIFAATGSTDPAAGAARVAEHRALARAFPG